MKLNSICSPFFQKTLVAKTKIKKSDEQKPKEDISIYKLDDSDSGYFSDRQFGLNWSDAFFLTYIKKRLPDIIYLLEDTNIFVMERESGECLGFAEAQDDINSTEILFLETSPIYRNDPDTKERRKKDSEFHYIGETFLAFFAKRAKKQGKSEIELESASDAVEFYTDKCYFSRRAGDYDYMFLPKEGYDLLIEQNKKHTDGKIKFDA